MKKLRYGSMAVVILLAVGAFLGAQRLAWIPGPWKTQRDMQAYFGNAAQRSASVGAAIAANPDDYMGYYRRGALLLQQRRYEEALADLNAAVRLSPTPLSVEALGARINDSTQPETHTLGLVVLVRTTRAEILQRMNRPDEALADFDQALNLDNRKTDILHARAVLRTVSGHYDDAIADFDALIAGGNNPQWYLTRGIAKYMKGDWLAAAADFLESARRQPEDATLIWLAKAYLRAGQPMPPDLFAGVGERSAARYVVEALMSDYDIKQFTAGVRAGAAYADRRNRDHACEAALFAGEWLIIRKHGNGAAKMLIEAKTACPPLSIEQAVATAEFKRLAP